MFCANLTRSFRYLNISAVFEYKSGLFLPPSPVIQTLFQKIRGMSHVAYFFLAHFMVLGAVFSTMLQESSLLGMILSRFLKPQAGFNACGKTWKQICVLNPESECGMFAHLSPGDLITALMVPCGVRPQKSRLKPSTWSRWPHKHVVCI